MIPGVIAGARVRSAAPSGFPVIKQLLSQGFTTSSTAHDVAMPASVAAGDLLIVVIGTRGSSANSVVTTPSGWTAGATQNNINNSTRVSVFHRVAAGSEGGTTVNFATAGAGVAVAHVFNIQSGSYALTPESSAATTSTTMHALPALTPSWGTRPVLWIGVADYGAVVTVTSWAYAANNQSVDGGTTIVQYVSTTQQRVASRPSGTYVTSGSVQGLTAVVAVCGSGA